jgi:hypothetical protein
MKVAGILLLVLGGLSAVASTVALIDRSGNFSVNPPEVCIALAITGAGILVAGALLLKR